MREGFRPLSILFIALFLLELSGSFVPVLAIQDSVRINIQWRAPENILSNDGIIRKKLNHLEVIFMEEFPEMPFYQFIIQGGHIEDFSISVLEYEDFNDEEIEVIKNVDTAHIPSPILNIKLQSKKPVSFIFMPSIAFDSTHQSIKKIKTFLIHYNLKQIDFSPIKRTSGTRNSVLASGDWYKFAVPSKGIYKITYDQLKSIGLPIDDIDSRFLKIYGNGGGMLPQKNDVPRHQDLQENAIYVTGEADGKFTSEDFILFYGQGADRITYNTSRQAFEYEKNIYSDSTYYFLTVDVEQGLRINSQSNLGETFKTIDYFDDYIVHEQDISNIIFSGREWYGEMFNRLQKLTHDFTFPIEGLKDNSEISIECSFLNMAYEPASYTLSLNNLEVATVDLATVVEGQYIERGVVRKDSFALNSALINLQNNHFNLKLSYNPTSLISTAHLDFLFFTTQRILSLYGNQTFFRSYESTKSTHTTYKISDVTSSSMVWDITDPLHPVNHVFNITNNIAQFGTASSVLKEYAVFDANHITTPQFMGKIFNQNLQGEGSYDMIIVTDEKFKAEALRLAAFRETYDHLSVKVVTIKEIYNEFSSGAKDVTAIRDYMKYLYDLDSNGEGLKYLLLFGKGSYDIKNKVPGNKNFVPIYGSMNSLHPIYSYSSDDYYGFLDDGEGEWIENTSGDHLMDIGIGRIPVKNDKEAKLIVDKIIHYSSSPEVFGSWRKKINFVADDGDFNLHQLDADKLANLVDTSHSEFNVNKIYLDSYPQIDHGNNFVRAPEVNKAINDAIKSGSLIVNYTGHGGQYQWADERILDTTMISNWKNQHKLPFFVTATCTFGKHDDAVTQSGGEKMLVGIKGGTIGLITSSRPVFSSTNYALNLSFYKYVFSKVDGDYQTLGDIFKEVKNTSLKGSINRNFSLLGDPSMKLSYPKENISITSINNLPPTEEADTLKALGKVNVKGKITSNLGGDLESFNGILYASVFDKLYNTTTLGTPNMTYKERNSTIFRGKASVVDGRFEFEFVVPKNISYDFNKGKISLYAVDLENKIDATGSNQKVKIGGSDPDAVVDRTPPEIKLYLNDTTFRSGGVTTSNSLLLARIYDENGIGITHNFNHQLTATLNDDRVYILNDFYETEIDNYQVGWVSYPMDDLPKGKNTLKMRAWDTHNNVMETTLEFYVEEDAKLSLNNVINYPNPFTEKTIFQFDHNAAGEKLLVRIDIFSIRGEHIYNSEYSYPIAPATINGMEWDGRNLNGQIIKEGIYIYKVSIQSEASGLKNQKYKRLIFKN